MLPIFEPKTNEAESLPPAHEADPDVAVHTRQVTVDLEGKNGQPVGPVHELLHPARLDEYMGAFLQEYLPVGLDAGLIYQT